MESPDEKEHILNPEGKSPILQLNWGPYAYEKEVTSRVNAYIEEKLKSKFPLFQQIENKIKMFCNKVCEELQEQELEWTNKMKKQWGTYTHRSEAHTDVSDIPTILLPLFTVFTAASFLVFTVISPILLPLWMYKGQTSVKKKLIAEAYDEIFESVRIKLSEKINSDWGEPLKKTICEVTDKVFHMLDDSKKRRQNDHLRVRRNTLFHREVLQDLQNKVNGIENAARRLQD